MPRVVHFEITAENPERAEKFWSGVFGWKLQKWEGPQPYWMITTGEDEEMGINGGMMPKSDGAFEGINSVVVVSTSSIDDTSAKVQNAGGTEIMPKQAVGTMGWVAYFKDTEGTVFGVWESNPEANQNS